MGNGKSKNVQYSKTIGGLRGPFDYYDSTLSREEYQRLCENSWFDLLNMDSSDREKALELIRSDHFPPLEFGKGFDADLIKNLKNTGTYVDFGNVKVPVELLNRLGIPSEYHESLQHLVPYYGDGFINMLNRYALDNTHLSVMSDKAAANYILGRADNSYVASALIDNRNAGVDLNNFIRTLNPDEKQLAYQIVNKQVSSLTYLNNLANSLGIDSVKSLSFLEDKSSGYYRSSDSNINITPNKIMGLVTNEIFTGVYDRSNSYWSVGASFPQSTVIHEFGHHIERSVFKGNANIAGNTAVSTYGNKNSHEAFAESFLAYCLGVTPTEGKEYYKNFKDLMNSSGLSKFEGSFKEPHIIKTNNTATNKVVSVTTASKPASEKTVTNTPTPKPATKPAVTSTNKPTPKPTATTKPVTKKVGTNNTGKTSKPSVVKTITKVTKTLTSKKVTNFTKTPKMISGNIKGKDFSSVITKTIRERGYIERTINNVRYRINIDNGTYTVVN